MPHPSRPDLTLALLQAEPAPEAAALAHLEDAAARAVAQGADLLIAPEMMVGGYNIGAAAVAALDAREAEITAALSRIAARHGIGLLCGLAMTGDDKPHNGALLLDRQGAELARYHKTHLYGDVDRSQFAPGAALSPVVMFNGWPVALAICYDVEFPEVARHLAGQGAEALLVPTANMEPYSSVCTRLVPARAQENGIFAAYANYVGAEGAFTYCGRSCICGPDGEDLARAPASDPALILATLRHADLERHRSVEHHLKDRRPDLYGPA